MLLAIVRLTERKHDAALAAARRAIQLDPNYPQAHAALAIVTRSVGLWDETLERTNAAIRLHPHHPSWYLASLVVAHFFKGEFNAAIAAAQNGVRRAESDFLKGFFQRLIAACLAERGLVEDARQQMAEAQILDQSTTGWYRGFFRFRDSGHLDRLLSALRKAGLPEQL